MAGAKQLYALHEGRFLGLSARGQSPPQFLFVLAGSEVLQM